MPGSGKFCWWTVRDRIGTLRGKKGYMPNRVVAYYFAGLPNAQRLAQEKCDRINNGTSALPPSPESYGGPD